MSFKLVLKYVNKYRSNQFLLVNSILSDSSRFNSAYAGLKPVNFIFNAIDQDTVDFFAGFASGSSGAPPELLLVLASTNHRRLDLMQMLLV
jgi:hypothetical protein